ncbi:MAG: mono/diheme cytochrome c family protein, partial [Verrucomicrobiales bacterium]
MPYRIFTLFLCLFGFASVNLHAVEEANPISYYEQIRPVFQANCVGCHQPSKNAGGYVMTDFVRMLAGG